MRYLQLINILLITIVGIYGVATLDDLGFWVSLLLLINAAKEALQYRRRAAADDETEFNMSGLNDSEKAEANRLYAKAIADYNEIDSAINNITDTDLKKILNSTEDSADKIISYVEKNPQAIFTARKFIETYQDRAAKLTNEYVALADSRLDSAKVAAVRARLKETLTEFEAAYLVEYEKLVSSSLIDTEAELDVMNDLLKSSDIKEKSSRIRLAREKENSYGQAKENNSFWGKIKKRLMDIFAKSSDNLPLGVDAASVITQKVTVGLLALVLGSLGAHKFFLGKTKQAVCYVLFCWSGIPGFIGFIEGLRYLLMPLDDFYYKVYKAR